MQLYNFIIEQHVKNALSEDIGYGDISTGSIAEYDRNIAAYLNTRVDGILCGREVFETVFRVLSKDVEIEFYFEDGNEMLANNLLAEIKGKASTILTGERIALNYIQRMSGIATYTNKFVKALEGYDTRIVDTRKNTPGFRLFEKYAVKTGGGSLHRFNLCDCIMLKDNHIALVGSVKDAIEAVRKNSSHAHKIEVECDTFDQVEQALEARADIIMLDNMTDVEIKKCVGFINKKALIEISGSVTLDNIKSFAELGADIISSSSLISKAGTLDIGLDF